MFWVIMNRRYDLKWFEPLVLKVGDTLEFSGELENIQGTGLHFQRPHFKRMQAGNRDV